MEIWRVEVEALKSELEKKNREFETLTINLLREMNEKEAETNNNDLELDELEFQLLPTRVEDAAD